MHFSKLIPKCFALAIFILIGCQKNIPSPLENVEYSSKSIQRLQGDLQNAQQEIIATEGKIERLREQIAFTHLKNIQNRIESFRKIAQNQPNECQNIVHLLAKDRQILTNIINETLSPLLVQAAQDTLDEILSLITQISDLNN